LSLLFAGSHPPGWLEEAGAPPLPEQNPPDADWAGDDPGDPGLPNQVPLHPPPPPPPVEIPEAEEVEVPAEADAPNSDSDPSTGESEATRSSIHSIMQDVADQVANMTVDPNRLSQTIPAVAFQCDAVALSDTGPDDLSGVAGCATFIGSSIDTATLTIELQKNLQDLKMKALSNGKMNIAREVLPLEDVHRLNPNLAEPIRQAVQKILNKQEKCPHTGRPIMRGKVKLPCKVDGVLTLDKLFLQEPRSTSAPDVFCFHQVHFDDEDRRTTAPQHVALCFFKQKIKQQVFGNAFTRRQLPGFASTSGGRSGGGGGRGGVNPPPDSPSSKRRRGNNGVPTSIMSIGSARRQSNRSTAASINASLANAALCAMQQQSALDAQRAAAARQQAQQQAFMQQQQQQGMSASAIARMQGLAGQQLSPLSFGSVSQGTTPPAPDNTQSGGFFGGFHHRQKVSQVHMFQQINH